MWFEEKCLKKSSYWLQFHCYAALVRVLSLTRERESVITREEIYTPQFQIIIIIIIIIMFIFTIKIITSVFVSVSVSVLSLSMSSHPSDQFQKGHMCLRQLCIGLWCHLLSCPGQLKRLKYNFISSTFCIFQKDWFPISVFQGSEFWKRRRIFPEFQSLPSGLSSAAPLLRVFHCSMKTMTLQHPLFKWSLSSIRDPI